MLSWWLPESVSTYGPDIDRLFYAIYYVTNAVFFAVQGTLIAFLFLYRHRDDRRATYTHGNTTLEIVWTIIPAIILIVLAFVSRETWANIKGRVPPGDVVLQVTAKQFNWEVAYPGPDGKLNTDDPQMFKTDIGHSYRTLFEARGWGKEQAIQFSLNGVEASWLGGPERASLRREFEEEIRLLNQAFETVAPLHHS